MTGLVKSSAVTLTGPNPKVAQSTKQRLRVCQIWDDYDVDVMSEARVAVEADGVPAHDQIAHVMRV